MHDNLKQAYNKLDVLNLIGQEVKKFKVNFKSGEINVSQLKKGMYLLNLKFTDNTNVSVKFIKK